MGVAVTMDDLNAMLQTDINMQQGLTTKQYQNKRLRMASSKSFREEGGGWGGVHLRFKCCSNCSAHIECPELNQ